LSPCPQRRDAQQKSRCDNAIAWSVEAGVACVLLPGAMRPPFSIAMIWVLRMMTNLDCSLERVRVRVGSTMSGGILTIWKVSETCVFPFALCVALGSYTWKKEVPLEQLSDIKAKSIVEWIANDRVRRSIAKHFRQFLMTYVDDHGASVYGQRIRNLGESEYFLFLLSTIS